MGILIREKALSVRSSQDLCNGDLVGEGSKDNFQSLRCPPHYPTYIVFSGNFDLKFER